MPGGRKFYHWFYECGECDLKSSSLIVYEVITDICFFIFNHHSNDEIMWQICTCHDSWAVITCANLWPDLIIIYHVGAAGIITRFELQAHKPFVKLVPDQSHNCREPGNASILMHQYLPSIDANEINFNRSKHKLSNKGYYHIPSRTLRWEISIEHLNSDFR